MSAITLALALALPGAPSSAQTDAADLTETVAEAMPRSTPAGHTFVAPQGFKIGTRGNVVTLQAPENDARVMLVEVASARDAADAAQQAWAAALPSMQRKLKLATPRPPRNGWTEQQIFDYETSPNERLTVFARTLRAGDAWLVQLVHAADATMEKRAGAMSQLSASIRPKGYTRESFAGKKPHPLNAARIEELKAFISKGMKLLDVPGVGFSLIDGNQVVWEGGLGVKALGKPAPVDARTLFIAASNTKSMTTALMAQAVDAGKLRWDQPVVEVFPSFKVGDADITKQVLVKHLVCACTGMPRQDMEWIFEYRGATPAGAVASLASMKPTSKFGEAFQYSNLMVSAGGYVAASVLFPGQELGAAYDRAMRERLFLPLGMNDTTFDFKRALAANHAEPHGDDLEGRTRRAGMALNYAIVPARPAGGVWTSPHDMSRWVLMELARGRTPEGRVLVSEAALRERSKPQVMVGEDVSYGMGLFVDKSRGIDVVQHGGDLLGYHSNMFWLPEFGMGGTILTNSDSGVLLRGPFLRKLLEVLFDGRPEADAQLEVAAANRKVESAKERERLQWPANAAAVAGLASRYVSPELGRLTVQRSGTTVRFDFDEWKSAVATRRNDDGTTSFVTIEPGYGGFEFLMAQRDGKRTLVLRDAQHEYEFMEARR